MRISWKVKWKASFQFKILFKVQKLWNKRSYNLVEPILKVLVSCESEGYEDKAAVLSEQREMS